MRVYIIGESFNTQSQKVRFDYNSAEFLLKKLGYEVVNPYKNFCAYDEKAFKINLEKLLSCNAVYILPSATYSNKNIEMLIAIKINLVVINN